MSNFSDPHFHFKKYDNDEKPNSAKFNNFY